MATRKKGPVMIESQHINLEPMSSERFYTGNWHYTDKRDRKRAKKEIKQVAENQNAAVVLLKDTGDGFDVKFYRFSDPEDPA